MTAEIPQENKRIKTIREFLDMDSDELAMPAKSAPTEAAPADLPSPETAPDLMSEQITEAQEHEKIVRERKRFSFKSVLSYALVFIAAFGFFYVLLNFRAVSEQVSGWVSSFANRGPKQLQAVDPEVYKVWFRKYYFYVNDATILGQGEDPDSDGLVNANEFHVGTNPLKKDTDGDGIDDGQEVLQGRNPLYEGQLLPHQQEVVGEFVSSESVQSRKSLERVLENGNELPVDDFVLDPSKPGNVSIPKLGVNAAILWSKTFDGMEDDLKYGTAHHPNTVYPGERGMASIHGHSSGNPWDGNYKTVFTKLNFLEPGDEVLITVFGTKGQSRVYRYAVKSKKIYAKSDATQFESQGGYHLNLSTSWPVGTARERYVVTTELVGL